MTETDADRFRKQADECRKLAERSASQPDKEAWLRSRTKLATDVEERRAKFWPSQK